MLVNRKGSFSKRNTRFAVPFGTEISRVLLKQAGEEILLIKTDTGWIVNGTDGARNSAVDFLLQTLAHIAIKSPVSDEIVKREITEAGLIPVRIVAFSGKRRVASFIVYRTAGNPYGNIARKSDRSKPFILYLPGYEASIGNSFTMVEDFWKPFNIFNENPSSVLSAGVEYPFKPGDSFRVMNPQSSNPGNQPADTTGINPAAVKRYLSYFTWVPFESWDTSIPRSVADSVISSRPFAIITLELADGKSKTLRLWNKTIISDSVTVQDTDRAWGNLNDAGNLFVVRYYDIDPILRKMSYFFQQE